MSTKLTRRQNEIRLRGLRILARIIVRAHLASLTEAEAGRNGSGDGLAPEHRAEPDGDPSRKEGGHAG